MKSSQFKWNNYNLNELNVRQFQWNSQVNLWIIHSIKINVFKSFKSIKIKSNPIIFNSRFDSTERIRTNWPNPIRHKKKRMKTTTRATTTTTTWTDCTDLLHSSNQKPLISMYTLHDDWKQHHRALNHRWIGARLLAFSAGTARCLRCSAPLCRWQWLRPFAQLELTWFDRLNLIQLNYHSYPVLNDSWLLYYININTF